MNKSTSFIALFTILLLLSATHFMKGRSTVIPKHPNRYEVETCAIEKCFDLAWSCQSDSGCLQQAQKVSSQYLANPSNYQQFMDEITNQLLQENYQCQTENCNKLSYLKSCHKEDAYYQNCALYPQSSCQTENPAYFAHFNVCATKQYPACQGISDQEEYSKCFAFQFSECSAEGTYLAKGELALSLSCF